MKKIALGAIVCLFISSCFLFETNTTTKPPVPSPPHPPMNDKTITASLDQLHFFHAWLADCVNDDIIRTAQPTATSALKTLARRRIGFALIDTAISNSFGSASLVWGPELITEKANDTSNGYVSTNLMYCLKQTISGIDNYHIGIAGTDMISSYDWFSEDFNVKQQVPFYTLGNISAGANTGFKALNGMVSPVSGAHVPVPLHQYLKGQQAATPTATISVSGHSLGGTLTQVYATFLRSQIKLNNVSAWVYAGPTAGDETFAKAVGHLGPYYAYNNSLDVIPHAWAIDSLNELCGIYTSIQLCSTNFRSNNYLVNGVINYLKSLTGTSIYKVPPSPARTISFPGKQIGFSKCSYLYGAVDVYWHDVSSWAFKDANEIAKHCGSPYSQENKCYIKWDDLYGFFLYLAEMGEQHTTGYFNHFFTKKSVKDAMNTYVPGGQSANEMFGEGLPVIQKFMDQAAAYYSTKGTLNCGCNK